MVDVIDLLQCPVCDDFYEPETTATGRFVPHCALPAYAPHLNLSLGQLAERLINTDYSAIEARVLAAYSQAAQLQTLTGKRQEFSLTGKLPYFIDEEV